MKGLTQFIVDLRNSHDVEEERKRINVEINNIHSKFAGGLNSYQKKKYICKLIYIHLLGYTEEVKFGFSQSLDLIALTDFNEKLLGYLLVSVLFTRDTESLAQFFGDLLEQVHLLLVLDLRANSEDVNCLALQFIASNFNASASNQSEHIICEGDPSVPLWIELVDLVYSLCVSPISHATTKKRAVAALNVMLKLSPWIISTNDNWVPRLLSLVDDPNLSVVLSVVPLVKTLTDVSPLYAKSIVPSIAGKLHLLVVDEACPQDFFYYEIPAPWLTISLIQLVEQLFLPAEHSTIVPLSSAMLDQQTVTKLRKVVSRSIQNASRSISGQQKRNAQSAILFQAVSLATFLDASQEAIEGATQALFMLLDSSETNTRYLVLDALIKLSARTKFTSVFKDMLDTIFKCLYDKDISVRKKAVDLLFTVCDSTNHSQIIQKLLNYYPVADGSLKSDIAVKVAVLAEQFATDSIWYVSTMLRLLALGGHSSRAGGITNGSGAEVWERITQIVVNNEDLHIKASKLIINLLGKAQDSPQPEELVKVAAFVLGEFGYKLVGKDDESSQFSPANQFHTLYDAYFRVSLTTRPLVLTSWLKFVYRYPTADFVPEILDLFEAETQSLDLEIQTRAHEYLKIASFLVSGDHNDHKFAESLLRSMPPFENKQNSLLNQLGSVKLVSGRSSSTVNVLKIPNHSVLVSAIKQSKPIPERSSSPNSGYSDSEIYEEDDDPFNDRPQQPVTLPLSPNWYSGYHRMLQYDAGIFYEDQLVKFTYRTVKTGHNIHIKFTVINNAAKTANTSITAFSVRDIQSGCGGGNPSYVVNLSEVPDLTIGQKTTMSVDVKVRDVVENNQSPVLSLTYKCSGSFNSLNLKIPVVLIKTLSPTALTLDDFKKRWLQIGEQLGAIDGESSGKVLAQYRHNSSNVVRILQRMGFAIIHSTLDSDEGILVMGAGIVHTMKSNYGVLVTAKSTDQVGRLFDIVIRSTGGGVSGVIYETLQEVFQS